MRATLMHASIVAAVAMFASPPVTMAALLLLIEAAAAAQAATARSTIGLASLRDVEVDALWVAMNALKTYVGGLCATVDANTARSIIEAAGLLVAKTDTPVKHLLTATRIPAMGIVRLEVNAMMLIGGRSRKKTTFTWSWSTDGGTTWSAGVTTGYTHADIPSLPPATYLFRVCATVGKVAGDWTQPAGLTIH
jgi:hypothetical protein